MGNEELALKLLVTNAPFWLHQEKLTN